jgi:hypothetical protein
MYLQKLKRKKNLFFGILDPESGSVSQCYGSVLICHGSTTLLSTNIYCAVRHIISCIIVLLENCTTKNLELISCVIVGTRYLRKKTQVFSSHDPDAEA